MPIARVASGLRTVAAALNRGDLVTANIAAVLLAMPDLPDAEAARRLACANALLKYNDAGNRDELGRWTAGGAAPDPADEEKAREWRKLGAKELAEFKGSFPPDSSKTEQHVYAMIYILEGGKEPDGDTSAGITPKTLKNARDLRKKSSTSGRSWA